MQESPGLRPDCFRDIICFSNKKLSISLQSNRSNILPQIGKSETAGQFTTACLSPFFRNWNNISFFPFEGKFTLAQTSFKNYAKCGLQIESPYVFNIRIQILSWL